MISSRKFSPDTETTFTNHLMSYLISDRDKDFRTANGCTNSKRIVQLISKEKSLSQIRFVTENGRKTVYDFASE